MYTPCGSCAECHSRFCSNTGVDQGLTAFEKQQIKLDYHFSGIDLVEQKTFCDWPFRSLDVALYVGKLDFSPTQEV